MSNIVNYSLTEFGQRMVDLYIPISNNCVSRNFISFVLNADLFSFIDYFELHNNKEEYKEEELEKLRRDTTPIILCEIAKINKDFTLFDLHSINTIESFKTIVKSFGFKEIAKCNVDLIYQYEDENDFHKELRTSPIHAEIVKKAEDSFEITVKEKEFFYYNEDNGFLWRIETRGSHTIQNSTLFGNIIPKVNLSDIDKIDSMFFYKIKLSHSMINGFSMDMSELPSYRYEELLQNYKPQKHWLVIPEPDFFDITAQAFFENKINKKHIDQMFGLCIERYEVTPFISSKTVELNYKSAIKNRQFVIDLILTEIMLDGFINSKVFLNVFNTHFTNKSFEEKNYLTHIILKKNRIKLKEIKKENFFSFIDKLNKKELKIIKKKKNDLIENFNIDHTIFEYLENKINKDVRH